MSVFVFLGPSLPVAEARRLLPGATFRPPAQQGDILRVLAERPAAIALIDGYFETVPSVWHKEVLLALGQGVRVLGAASMGALRAAELHRFGMEGVGTIFEWYRDGIVDADDEVAIVHAPAELGFIPLSTALVDIRHACTAAVSAGIVAQALADRLLAAARGLYFPDRTFEAVARQVQLEGGCAAEIGGWLAFCRKQPGLKRSDAAELLRTLAASSEIAPRDAEFTLERTSFFESFGNEVAFEGRRPATAQTRAALLLRLLARQEAERFGWSLEADEVGEYASRWLMERGRLADAGRGPAAALPAAFWRYINDMMLIEKLERLFSAEISAELVDHAGFADDDRDDPAPDRRA